MNFRMKRFYPPPIISGNPVISATSVEDVPEDFRARAVPPVEIISTSYLQSFSASGTKSVLSDTEGVLF